MDFVNVSFEDGLLSIRKSEVTAVVIVKSHAQVTVKVRLRGVPDEWAMEFQDYDTAFKFMDAVTK